MQATRIIDTISNTIPHSFNNVSASQFEPETSNAQKTNFCDSAIIENLTLKKGEGMALASHAVEVIVCGHKCRSKSLRHCRKLGRFERLISANETRRTLKMIRVNHSSPSRSHPDRLRPYPICSLISCGLGDSGPERQDVGASK